MRYDDLVSLARQKAQLYGLDESLVCAVVEQESAWNTFAIRFEPSFYERYIAKLLGLTPTEAYSRAFSWGLMQVMGQVAREQGFEGSLSTLCQPENGLDVGCKYFKDRLELARGEVSRALLLWNGGGNPNYAAQVLNRRVKFEPPASLNVSDS